MNIGENILSKQRMLNGHYLQNTLVIFHICNADSKTNAKTSKRPYLLNGRLINAYAHGQVKYNADFSSF